MTDGELIATCKDFRDGILAGKTPSRMCAAVCFPLESFLSVLGVQVRAQTVRFTKNPTCANHVFLRLPDGRILDPTADQFGPDPVYLGPFPDLYLSWGAKP